MHSQSTGEQTQTRGMVSGLVSKRSKQSGSRKAMLEDYTSANTLIRSRKASSLRSISVLRVS